MARYFIELAYLGKNYAGFQVQQNANTIQGELEKALLIYFREQIALTGSSRTDAGVHALQNYFHFDNDVDLSDTTKVVYHLNAILPLDIVVKRIFAVAPQAHCRFDAIERSYGYNIHNFKDPFVSEQSFFYPYPLQQEAMQQAASLLLEYSNFKSFAKKKVQVFTFECTLTKSEWVFSKDGKAAYFVTGNRFLRGMVRGLTGTMLKVGTGKISVNEFKAIIERMEANKTDFSVPGHGLCLMQVNFPNKIIV